MADGGLLGDQPRMLCLLPDIHWAAHNEEQVEAVQGRDGLVLIELDRGDVEPGCSQQWTERARILVRMMLEDEGASERGVRCGSHGRMSRYSLRSHSLTVPMKRSHSSRL